MPETRRSEDAKASLRANTIAGKVLADRNTLDELAPQPTWRHLTKDSSEARAYLVECRPQAMALAKIFSTGFAGHSSNLTALTQAAYPKMLGHWLVRNTPEHNLETAHLLALGTTSGDLLDSYVTAVDESKHWSPAWKRWGEFVEMEKALRPKMPFFTPKEIMEAGLSSARQSSTQILELLIRVARESDQLDHIDLPVSAWANRKFLYRLASLQDERSGVAQRRTEKHNPSKGLFKPLAEDEMRIERRGRLLISDVNFHDLKDSNGSSPYDVPAFYPLIKCPEIKPLDLGPDLVSGGTFVTQFAGMIDQIHKASIATAPLGVWQEIRELTRSPLTI